MSDQALTITDLRKEFGHATAVDGISLSVPPGSFLVLLGPSGCGKTTTLRMLAGLEKPTGGEIAFADQVVARGDGSRWVPPAERGAGLVFQSYALWPHKTVRDNIEWPLAVAKWPKAQRRLRSDEVLGLLAISELADRYPSEISGGQQQRVAIARMVAAKPSILLFDEPLSNLDAKLRVDTRAELLHIHRATGATSVYVTHDQVEAMTMATHIALLNHGRIEQFGTPEELLLTPSTAFTATFIGTPPANLLPGHGGQQWMYRATSLTATNSTDPDALPALFCDQAPMAGQWVVGAQLGDNRRVSIISDHRLALLPGEEMGIRLPTTPDARFSAEGKRL